MRATNDSLQRQQQQPQQLNPQQDQVEEPILNKEVNPESESAEQAAKEIENNAKNRKKTQNNLIRSDSTGSTSGRKFLAPTLSDPQAKNEKDRYMTKKKSQRQQGSNTKTITQINELNHSHTLHQHYHHLTHGSEMQQNNNSKAGHPHINMVYEVYDWWQEQVSCTHSDDEDV